MVRFDVTKAAELIFDARRDAGLTQALLALRVGISQPNLAQMEAGKRTPSPEMLERILGAADYRPSIPVERYAKRIRELAEHRGLRNPRVFGSVVRGEDHFDSDIDLLVSPSPQTTLFTLAALAADVEDLTGFPADVVSDSGASTSMGTENIVRQAVPL